MQAISFLHQKGGTGKSSLAIAAALALARRGEAPLLLDADPQGTSMEWGNRFGHAWQIETQAYLQADLHTELATLASGREWILIDAPPALTALSESILRASTRVIIPLRPAFPDLWALTWPAAILHKLAREGQGPAGMVVFNMHQGEALEPLRAELERLSLPVHEQALPFHPAFPALYRGTPLPEALESQVLELIGALS